MSVGVSMVKGMLVQVCIDRVSGQASLWLDVQVGGVNGLIHQGGLWCI